MRVVGDQYQRLRESLGGPAQHIEHLVARTPVEGAGRLVGEDDRRTRDERAGNGDPLCLAPGQFARHPLGHAGQPDRVDEGLLPLLVWASPVEQHRQLDVLTDGQVADEVVRLKHESDVAPAETRNRVQRELGNVGVADEYLAAGGRIKACGKVEESRLARTGRAHNSDEGTGLDGERDPLKRGYYLRAVRIGLVEFSEAHGGIGRRRACKRARGHWASFLSGGKVVTADVTFGP